jgi:hypothetical protein
MAFVPAPSAQGHLLSPHFAASPSITLPSYLQVSVSTLGPETGFLNEELRGFPQFALSAAPLSSK